MSIAKNTRPMGALLLTEHDGKWMLPRRLEPFLALLAQSPRLGKSDAERVARFMTFPQAASMPASLRRDLETLR